MAANVEVSAEEAMAPSEAATPNPYAEADALPRPDYDAAAKPEQVMFGAPVTISDRTCAAFCVIWKQNEPLYFSAYGEYGDKGLYFQSLVFCSLDIVDECVALKKNQQDMYLGFLCPVDEFQIFGYMTNTNVKFIAVIDDRKRPVEQEWRQFFTKCHTAYVEYLRNPFNVIPPDVKNKIEAPSFAAKIDAAVDAHLETAIARPPTPITDKEG